MGGWREGGRGGRKRLNAIALTRPLYLEAHSRGRDVAAGYRRGKTGSASDGQGLPVPLYQCKTDYFLGQRGHFTFYKPPFFFFFPSFFFRAYINFESRGEAERLHRARARNRERQTGLEKKGREGQMKSIFRTPETSGFIFGDPKGNCK